MKSVAKRARPAEFMVTALGEMLRNGDLLPCSSVELTELARRRGIEAKVWMADPPPPWWKATVTREFNRKMRAELASYELVFANHVHSLQRRARSGRFRVYGWLKPDGPEVRLLTEFRAPAGDKAAWAAIETVRFLGDALIATVDESPEIDHAWKLDKNGNRVEEKFGPDHGRLMRQVELYYRVEEMGAAALGRLIRRMTRRTEGIWQEYGVNVI